LSNKRLVVNSWLTSSLVCLFHSSLPLASFLSSFGHVPDAGRDCFSFGKFDAFIFDPVATTANSMNVCFKYVLRLNLDCFRRPVFLSRSPSRRYYFVCELPFCDGPDNNCHDREDDQKNERLTYAAARGWDIIPPPKRETETTEEGMPE
jgi:hypothetical protein